MESSSGHREETNGRTEQDQRERFSRKIKKIGTIWGEIRGFFGELSIGERRGSGNGEIYRRERGIERSGRGGDPAAVAAGLATEEGESEVAARGRGGGGEGGGEEGGENDGFHGSGGEGILGFWIHE